MRFSVIVPVYNAGKTLRRCVDSLLHTPQDLEIILVNDGSRDDSDAICQSYAARDSRIRYIVKENGGVSSARNAGLDVAVGRYVLFVDSDDYVPSTLFSDIEEALRLCDWDLLRLSYCVDDGVTKREHRAQSVSCLAREEAFPKIIADICNKSLNSPWAKLYRKDVIDLHQIRFPLGVSVAEDRAFNIKYSMYVQSYRVSDSVGYYVNTENEQSLSRKQHKDLSAQFAVSGEYVLRAIAEASIPEPEKEAYRRAYNFGVCRTVYKDAKDLRREGTGWSKRQKQLFQRCRAINRTHMRYPGTSYCRKISLPVRLYQTWLIDLVAKRLTGH